MKKLTDGMLSDAQADRVSQWTDKLKRYFKYMDAPTIIKNELIDGLLDSVGDGFAFRSPSSFAKEDMAVSKQRLQMDQKNLEIYNKRQSLVPRLNKFLMHAIRSERDRILKAIKNQIEGSHSCVGEVT